MATKAENSTTKTSSKKKTSKKKAPAKKKVTGKKTTAKKTSAQKTTSASTTKKKTTRTSKTNKSSAARFEINAEERWRMIANSAYLKAEARGFAPGHETEDWLQAEKEVDALLRGKPQK
jgi:hypothetical protein